VNCLITENELSKDLTLRPDGTVAPLDDDVGDVVELLPHADATAATPTTAPHRVPRVSLPEFLLLIRMPRSSCSQAISNVI
jgi:hypothetical protein